LASSVYGAQALAESAASRGTGLEDGGRRGWVLERFTVAGILLLGGAATAIAAIRFFEPAAKPPKTIGVHRLFPFSSGLLTVGS